ncbi:MAG: hypothetical protein F6K09_07935 [Merismopedia sp. SIO2A8]|nr:hypothetical protein [Merismopedia sp. SIO2A8]
MFATRINQQQAEGAIAVHHALFKGFLLRSLNQWLQPPLPPPPCTLPISLNLTPTVAWVGFTESEARQRYGNKLTTLYQSFKSLDQAQLLTAQWPTATSGSCTLLVIPDGQIVGAEIVGIRAEDLIAPIALAMQQNLPMAALAQLHPPFPSLTTQLLQSLTLQWEREHIKRRPFLFDGLELFFNWQRDWS